MDTKPTYRVEFNLGDATLVIANDIPVMENAVEFALNLHRASNTEHIIHVIHDDLIDVTFIKHV